VSHPPIALITGATSGIGAAVAGALAARGYRLLITGRDGARGRAAEQDLLRRGATAVTFLPTDHASMEATDQLVEHIRSHTDVLDLLVANAAVMPLAPTRTSEGLEPEIAVDVLGVTTLVDGLLPLLSAAPRARVVMVTSDAATRFPVGITDDPWQARRAAPVRAYAKAKRWKMHLATAYAEELYPQGVVVHAASPGPAWTSMTRALTRHALGVPAPLWWIIRGVQRTQRPERAAGCVLRAATDPALARCTGQLTRGTHQTRPIPTDPTIAAEALTAARHLTATSRETRSDGLLKPQAHGARYDRTALRDVTLTDPHRGPSAQVSSPPAGDAHAGG